MLPKERVALVRHVLLLYNIALGGMTMNFAAISHKSTFTDCYALNTDEVISPANEPEFLAKMYRKIALRRGYGAGILS